MTDKRKFSRERHQIKMIRREEVENRLKALLFAAMKEEDPTIYTSSLSVIAEVSATIASQLMAQTQSTHRSLITMKDDAVDYGTEFVVQLVAEAKKDISARFKRKTTVAPVTGDGVALADDWAGPVAGPTDLERFFGIPRSTIYRWQKRNEIIFLNTRTSRKPVFPLKQFRDGRPTAGIAEVVQAFPDPRSAWHWLIEANADVGDVAPIDQLLSGNVGVVIDLLKSRDNK